MQHIHRSFFTLFLAAMMAFSPVVSAVADTTPVSFNDPHFAEQWAHRATQTDLAWNYSKGSKNVIVAVIDSKGVDINHEDLKNNISELSWDFIDNDNNPSTPSAHGTLVAGVIGAVGNNGVGVAGVMPEGVTIMALRAQTYNQVLDAIRWAIDHGAHVVNLSMGFTMGRENAGAKMKTLIAEGTQKGVIFVTSAGNETTDTSVNNFHNWQLPCHIAETICVGATMSSFGTEPEKKHPWSNYGSDVDVWAPGSPVWSTRPGNQYGNVNGATSMSSPYVAGVAGLLKSYKPSLTAVEIREIILSTTDTFQSEGTTIKRVNTLKAMQKAAEGTVTPPPPPQENQAPVFENVKTSYLATQGSAVSFTVTALDPENTVLRYTINPLLPDVAFDETNGTFSWAVARSGEYRFTVTARDSGTPFAMGTIDISLSVIHGDPLRPEPPKPPVTDPLPPETASGKAPRFLSEPKSWEVSEGGVARFFLSATDEDSAQLTWNVTGLPANCGGSARKLINKKSELFIMCSPGYNQSDTYSLSISAKDTEGNEVKTTVPLIIRESGRSAKNNFPEFASVFVPTIISGKMEIFIPVKDPEGDTVSVKVIGGTLYLKEFDQTTGKLVMEFPKTVKNQFLYPRLRATDSQGNIKDFLFPVYVSQ